MLLPSFQSPTDQRCTVVVVVVVTLLIVRPLLDLRLPTAFISPRVPPVKMSLSASAIDNATTMPMRYYEFIFQQTKGFHCSRYY